MLRSILFLMALAISHISFGQAEPSVRKDVKQMPGEKSTTNPKTKVTTAVVNKLLPPGKCCKVNVAHPSGDDVLLSAAKTTCITDAIPGLSAADCGKSKCKVDVFDASGRPVLKGWNVVVDKTTGEPVIDARTLPKGKYKVRFVSGTLKGERLLDLQ